MDDEGGYLYCISTSNESYMDLIRERERLQGSGKICVLGGSYNNGGAVGVQDIWITFDDRVTDTVLGMDILQQVIFTANPYTKKIYFCKDIDDYNNNFELLTT